MRNRAAAGSLKGNLYAFAFDPCPYIIVQSVAKVNSQVNTRSIAHSGQISGNSILEKKDRKNTLSLSSQEKSRARLEALTEPDIAFHWPQLAVSGFGTHQIRQIMERLEQRDLSPDNVLQGLDHAEWVLERGLMKDKDGQAVLHPNNWVFQILAKQGYYPRPAGYMSPQEQAERDAAEEQKRLAAALEERLKAECEAWIAGLSEDEHRAIVGNDSDKRRMPDGVALRNYFRTKVWPGLRNGSTK